MPAGSGTPDWSRPTSNTPPAALAKPWTNGNRNAGGKPPACACAWLTSSLARRVCRIAPTTALPKAPPKLTGGVEQAGGGAGEPRIHPLHGHCCHRGEGATETDAGQDQWQREGC